MTDADLKKGAKQPTYEQIGEVAQLVGQVHGLKLMVEKALRDSASSELPYHARCAWYGLDDVAQHLNHALHRLTRQKSRNLMDLLGRAHDVNDKS